MPYTRNHAELDRAAAEMLRKMADFVERGEASEIDFERVTPVRMMNGELAEVEYAVRIRVREEQQRG